MIKEEKFCPENNVNICYCFKWAISNRKIREKRFTKESPLEEKRVTAESATRKKPRSALEAIKTYGGGGISDFWLDSFFKTKDPKLILILQYCQVC